MSRWSQWESVRRQVVVAGRVVDAHDNPVAGAEVTLARMPAEAKRKSGSKSDEKLADAKCDRAWTRPDGIFFFLDVPPAKYSIECVGRSGAQDKKLVTVSRNRDGTVIRAVADLKLSTA